MSKEKKCLNCQNWKQRKGMNHSWEGRCTTLLTSRVMDDVCNTFRESIDIRHSEIY